MNENIDLVRNYYRSYNAVAEHLSDKEIKQAHIETSVDSIIRKYINENKIIFVTGHPGDGKTHLIKRIIDLEKNKIEVELDANVGYEKLAAKIG